MLLVFDKFRKLVVHWLILYQITKTGFSFPKRRGALAHLTDAACGMDIHRNNLPQCADFCRENPTKKCFQKFVCLDSLGRTSSIA
jgi:hypothetical protein